ncbi:MAG: rubredoxin [Treponemataceae bacterium]
MSKFVCDLCGYVYDKDAGVPDKGVAAGTDFSALPGDWKCPMCNGEKKQFYEVK